MPRLFIAISLPDARKAELVSLSRPLRSFGWTPSDRLHLTLRFLGEVPESETARLERELEGVRVLSFLLHTEGLGVFPAHPPFQVLWAGLGRAHPRLFQLRQQIDDRLLRTGVATDLRRFHPHVTLARLGRAASEGAVRQFLKDEASFEGAPFEVEGFGLFESTLLPKGALHSLRRSYPLARSGQTPT